METVYTVLGLICLAAIWIGLPWDARRQDFRFWWVWGIFNFFFLVPTSIVYLIRRYARSH